MSVTQKQTAVYKDLYGTIYTQVMPKAMNRLPLIETHPATWKDLQDAAGKILAECGYHAETDKSIQTARGPVNVDIYARDTSRSPQMTLLVECKHWTPAVPKTIVHAFRSVVSDFGANVGYIVSSAGFQSGAFVAADNSPIRLVTWEEFQGDFLDEWVEKCFVPKVAEAADPLIEYTEPINSRIFRKADDLPKERQGKFKALRNKYLGLGALALPFSIRIPLLGRPSLELPLRRKAETLARDKEIWMPDDLLDACTLREFLDALCRNAALAISEFDDVFGGRA